MTKKKDKPEETGNTDNQQAKKVNVGSVGHMKKPEKTKVSTIYTGPNVPGGKLAQFTVFRDGVIAPHIKLAIDKYPAIKRLIVPINTLAEVQKKLKDKQSVESNQFQTILSQFKKGEE